MIIKIKSKSKEKMLRCLMASGIEYTFPAAQEAAGDIIVKDAIELKSENEDITYFLSDDFVSTLEEFISKDLDRTSIPDSFSNLMYKFDGFKEIYKAVSNNEDNTR